MLISIDNENSAVNNFKCFLDGEEISLKSKKNNEFVFEISDYDIKVNSIISFLTEKQEETIKKFSFLKVVLYILGFFLALIILFLGLLAGPNIFDFKEYLKIQVKGKIKGNIINYNEIILKFVKVNNSNKEGIFFVEKSKYESINLTTEKIIDNKQLDNQFKEWKESSFLYTIIIDLIPCVIAIIALVFNNMFVFFVCLLIVLMTVVVYIKTYKEAKNYCEKLKKDQL